MWKLERLKSNMVILQEFFLVVYKFCRGDKVMCMYCERRQDVKFGWEQPKLPYHNQEDISAILSGNVLENEKCHVG